MRLSITFPSSPSFKSTYARRLAGPFFLFVFVLGALPPVVSGVGTNPDPIPSVWGTDGSSRKYNRWGCFVRFTLQVRVDTLEYQPSLSSNEAVNVLDQDEPWPELSNQFHKVRPEEAVVFRASSSACM